MKKIFMNAIVFLLFLTNRSEAQFNTVRDLPAQEKTGKPVVVAIKTDSLEWVNEQDSTVIEQQADTVQNVEEVANISLPLKHPEVTSGFGYRIHPVDKVRMFHAGIDLKAKYEPFYCFADGTVLRTGYSERSGNYLVVSHGKLETVYCHLSQVWVKEGEQVNAGQLLGITGNTGETTGAHLHFGMRWEGEPVNPLKVIEWVMSHQLMAGNNGKD